MTLRSRLMVAFAYLLLLAIIALSIPLGVHVARRARDDFALELNKRAELVARGVPRALEQGPEALDALVAEDPLTGRVIVVNRDARLIADSRNRRWLRRDYMYRPEIVEALRGHTTRLVRDYNVGKPADLQYIAAIPVVDDGEIVGAVRVSQAVAAVDALVRRRLIILAAGCFGVLLIALIAAALLARSLSRPLRRLGEVAAVIGDGDLGARADETGQPEVAEVAAALNAMSRRIEQSMTLQTEFVANASHQLRTPLTGLRLRLEALAANGAPGADAAIAETDRLASLVEDLLTLVRAGTHPVGSQTVDLDELAQTAVDRWHIQAADGGHRIEREGVGDMPRPVVATTGDLEIVLDNLIENALKYTAAGCTVTVSLRADEDNVVLTVSDDGPGIPPDDHERAFERFYRGSGGTSVPGTGLGLAIVRQIAQRWGGGASLTSGNGTSISVFLPAADVVTSATAELEVVSAP